jgi:hypothetical protein
MAKRSPSNSPPHNPTSSEPEGEETDPREAKVHPPTVSPPLLEPYESLGDKERHIKNIISEHEWIQKSVLENVSEMQNPALMDNVIRRLQNSKKLLLEALKITEKKTLPYSTYRSEFLFTALLRYMHK